MSFNGTGTFNINTGGQPVVTGTTISSTVFNALTADLANGLTNTLTKDGQSTPTNNIKFGGYKLTGVGQATVSGDALAYGLNATINDLTITGAVTLSGGINGTTINSTTIGATTPSTGAFTTLSASSTVSGAGFTAYFASPPAIGGTAAAAITGTTITGTTITANTRFVGAIDGTVGATTPATGAFTTLSASSTVSGTGFSTYLASPPAIGGTAAAAGTFTTLIATTNINSTRINPRVISINSAATITPTGNTADQYNVIVLSTPATIAIPTGTPVDGQRLTIRIKDDGFNRALTWTTSAGGYRAMSTALPTTTVAGKTLYVICIYMADDGFWDAVTVSRQA